MERLLAQLPAGEAPEAGQQVDRIQVAGNRRIESESILNRVDLSEGDGFDRAVISSDIGQIYELGYFEDIKVDARVIEGDTLVVTYLVEEKPAVAEIAYEGNNKIDDDKLSKTVTFRKRTILDVNEIKQSAEKIRQKYVDKGYYLAEVDYEISQVEKRTDQVKVTFQVREYAKVQVKDILILGNESIPADTLKRSMKTKEGNFLSIISNMGNFTEADFEKDLKRLTARYYQKGHVEVSVGMPSIRLSKDKRYLYITIRIEEGPQFRVGDLGVQGDLLKSREELLDMVELENGDIFNYAKMRKDMQELTNLYKDKGYAFAQVQPLTRINREAKTVDVNFKFAKGQKVHFRRIRITGNQKTMDRVIRRELEIAEGDLYSQTDIDASRRAVRRLGFFKSVEVTTQRVQGSDNQVDVTVRVNERRTGNFQLGAGFSSTESIIGNLRISQNNLFGRGQTLSVQGQLSAVRTLFNLQFTEPWLFGSQWQLSINAYNFDYLYQDFARQSTGGELSLGYPISEAFDWNIPGEFTLRGRYTLERVSVESGGRAANNLSRPGAFFDSGITSSLGLELSYDTRNNQLFPTKGQYTTASVEVADDTFTGSETEFVRTELETRVYIPLFWEFVLRLNGQLGYIAGLNENRPVPLFERYFVGGPETTRGFERYTLGPTLNVAGSGGDPGSQLSEFSIGGNKQLLLTAEIEFPILQSAGVKGVVFADAGNAFGANQPLTLALDVFKSAENNYRDALRTAVGFGFRWRSPFGPLRFEWGFPLSRLRGEQGMVFDFSISNGF
jgi:outer membrane protein insertion porin family